ncbi:MAG: TlpA disulfide reductase family protein [Atribacterota bacterium]
MQIRSAFTIFGIFVTVLCGVSCVLAQEAPLFRLPGLDGKEYALSDFRGQPVILTFFTTWCPYCAEELPLLEKLYREYREKASLVVLGIDLQESEGVVRKFVERIGISFPVLLDAKGESASSYRVLGLPMLFFIDPWGRIADVIIGGSNETTIRRKLDRILWFRGLLLPEVRNLLTVLQGVTLLDFRKDASNPFPEIPGLQHKVVSEGDDLSFLDPQGTYVVLATTGAEGKTLAASLAQKGFQRVYYLMVDDTAK